MTASSNASRRIAAGMLALSLVLCPLSACGKKAPEGPAAVTGCRGLFAQKRGAHRETGDPGPGLSVRREYSKIILAIDSC